MSVIRKKKYINLAVCFMLLIMVYVAMVTFMPKMSLWSRSYCNGNDEYINLEPGMEVSYRFAAPVDRLTGIKLFFGELTDKDIVARTDATVILTDSEGRVVYSSEATSVCQDVFNTGSLELEQGQTYTVTYRLNDADEFTDKMTIGVTADGDLGLEISGTYNGVPSKSTFLIIYSVISAAVLLYVWFYGNNDPAATDFCDKFILGVGVFLSVVLINQFFDLFMIGRAGLRMLDSILDGKLFSFFDYAYIQEVIRGSERDFFEIPYSTVTYIIVAIIMIPFRFFTDGNIGFSSIANVMVLYLDVVVAGLFLWSVKLTQRICDACDMPPEYKRSVKYLYSFSPVLLLITIGSGQIDIIYLIIMMFAFPLYYQGRYRLFALVTALAVAVKPIPLMVFIPVILLVNKKVKDILINTGICLSVYAVFKFLFDKGTGYDTIWSIISSRYTVIGRVTDRKAGDISLFLIAFSIICLASFIKKIDVSDKKAVLYHSMLVIFVTYASFAAFVNWHSQWLIPLVFSFAYLMPFIAKNKSVLLIEYALELLIFLVSGLTYGTVYMIEFGLLAADGFEFRGVSICEALSNAVSNADTILITLLAAVSLFLAAFFVIKNPYRNAVAGKIKASDLAVDRSMAIGRIFVYFSILLISYWLYCYTG